MLCWLAVVAPLSANLGFQGIDTVAECRGCSASFLSAHGHRCHYISRLPIDRKAIRFLSKRTPSVLFLIGGGDQTDDIGTGWAT